MELSCSSNMQQQQHRVAGVRVPLSPAAAAAGLVVVVDFLLFYILTHTHTHASAGGEVLEPCT